MSSNVRYLVFIEKPSVMPDGKTPDPNYLVAYMLNNLPPQIRGNFEHHIIDPSTFHEWKSRIPQLVQTTPQLVDASNGQVLHGIQCVFFLYQTLFRINPSFLLSSISPNLQQLDYQFRSQLMPPQQQQAAAAQNTGSIAAQAQAMRQNARPPMQSGRAPSSQLPARPNNSNTKNNMMLSSSGRPVQAQVMQGGGQAGVQVQNSSKLKTNFLSPSMIPDSASPVGGDMNSIGYTVHKDLLYYNLPKGAEIPKELETYLVGSENPDLDGEGDMLSGIPSNWEDRAGFLGIMETGPTQFDDKSTNLMQDYNDNSDFLDISQMDISNKPINTGGMKESYDSQSMREMRRGGGGRR